MADCLKSNLSVQEPVYCKNVFGNDIPDTAMYSWMAIRAAGPNVLKDTTLCGVTKIQDSEICAYSYSPCCNIYLQQIPGVLSEIVEAANQAEEWHIINSESLQAYTQQFNYSTDNYTTPGLIHPAIVASCVGQNPNLLKTIGVQNLSGRTLLLEVELNATVANNTNTGTEDSMTYYFAFGSNFDVQPLQPIEGSNPLKLGVFDAVGTAPQQAEESFTIKAYVSLQNDQSVFPIWQPYNPVAAGQNSLYWRSINFSARVIGCKGTMNLVQTQPISGPG